MAVPPPANSAGTPATKASARARAARSRAGSAAAARDLLLLKARDVRKVDPVLGGRIEPVILVRTGVILVSLGRTELRALIHERGLEGRVELTGALPRKEVAARMAQAGVFVAPCVVGGDGNRDGLPGCNPA